jgi:hypothetical protein
VRTYQRHIADLAPLESFDAAVFVAKNPSDQHVCDFILGLALAFNDLRDLLIAHDILATVTPQPPHLPTPDLGEFNGVTLHHIEVGARSPLGSGTSPGISLNVLLENRPPHGAFSR